MPAEVTTIADDLVVVHVDGEAFRYEGLEPDTTYTFHGLDARTLPRPAGELLCRFATVNDVHFGETVCGRIDDHPIGPILTSPPGEPPYPQTMNSGAVAEILGAGIDTVVVKGDLTNDGQPEEIAAFEAMYVGAFGDRVHAVRGNHDSYKGQGHYAGDRLVELDGVSVALLDTVIPEHTTGRVTTEQAEWLDAVGAASEQPVLVMGHHQTWVPGSPRDPAYFGLDPDSADRLIDVIARRPRLLGYFAGHTHRHRVRWTEATGAVPYVEVGCVKDFPGTWAEYRVHDTAILQVVHRISSPEALAWSEQCRGLYRDFGVDYESYALGPLDHRCFTIPLR